MGQHHAKSDSPTVGGPPSLSASICFHFPFRGHSPHGSRSTTKDGAQIITADPHNRWIHPKRVHQSEWDSQINQWISVDRSGFLLWSSVGGFVELRASKCARSCLSERMLRGRHDNHTLLNRSVLHKKGRARCSSNQELPVRNFQSVNSQNRGSPVLDVPQLPGVLDILRTWNRMDECARQELRRSMACAQPLPVLLSSLGPPAGLVGRSHGHADHEETGRG